MELKEKAFWVLVGALALLAVSCWWCHKHRRRGARSAPVLTLVPTPDSSSEPSSSSTSPVMSDGGCA
jgi:hypothetical protein